MANKKIILLFVSLFLISFSFGCISPDPENNYLETQKDNLTEFTEPYNTIQNHNSYKYYTYDELQDMSFIIVSGRIISISESKWSTPDGKKPEGFGIIKIEDENGTYLLNNAILTWNEFIYTDAVFKIETVYKGDLEEDEIVVRFLTGIADGWRSSDAPGIDIQSYEEGETCLFFLIPHETYLEGKVPNHYRILSPRGALKQESSPLNQDQETFMNFYGEQFTPKILIE